MTPEALFQITTPLALIGWLALLFFPGSRIAVEWIARGIVPALLAFAYAAILIFAVGGDLDFSAFSTLEGIASLQGSRWALLAGWLHYLAFDLLVGAWQVRTARDEGIPHLAVVPCLFFTFMLGPVGFLMFLAVRALFARRKAAPARA